MNNLLLDSVSKIKESLVETEFQRGSLFDFYSSNYYCDCSSLISSILKIENRAFFNEICDGKKNLKSFEYFDYAKKKKLFVSNIEEVLPGDILCWKKSNIPKSGDSGHMAIIISSPFQISKNKYSVRVFDSTKTPHSCDTRIKNGVGEGDLFLHTSDDLEIIGVQWSSEHSKIKRTEILSIRF